MRKAMVIPRGIPAEVNPRNTGILEQEQNGVMAPKQDPSKYPTPMFTCKIISYPPDIQRCP
jgi:hypothetical protein